MKIVIDARFTRNDHHDGISRYGASLIAATAKIADVSMLISDTRQLALLPDVPYTLINSPLSPAELFVARRVNPLGRGRGGLPDADHGQLGTQLRPGPDPARPYLLRAPRAAGFLPAPVRILWRMYHKAFWPQRLLLNRADIVATISRTTEALMAKYRLTSRPVRIISNAPQPAQEPRDPAAGADHTLVYMGSFMPYKNVETLVAGMSGLPGLHAASAEQDHARNGVPSWRPWSPPGPRWSSTMASPMTNTTACSDAPPRWSASPAPKATGCRWWKPCPWAHR